MEMEMEMEEPSSSSLRQRRHADDGCARRRFRQYLDALEEERRKIHVFQRELPLCLDLVTQTIEGMRSRMDGVGGGGEETVSDHGVGPVLEEFIPLKPSLSLSCSEEDSTHAAAATTPETKKAMPDWLQSVQLWSQQPQQSSPNKELPCKPVAVNATKAGGAFHPFEKEKRSEAAELPASSTTAAASSAVFGDSADKAITSDTEEKDSKDAKSDKDKDKDKEGQSQPKPKLPNRKPRRCWAPELHRRFLQALQQLGGSHAATPKLIRELMKVDGLTNDEVKSHLQKYRLHTTRRPSSTAQSNGAAAAAAAAQPAPQFVVVGSCIWVPPPEYAAAVAAAQPQVMPGAADASGSSKANAVYAPVATLPSGLQRHAKKLQKQQQGERQSSRRSEGWRSTDTGDASSASPAVSSSSQTTSA